MRKRTGIYLRPGIATTRKLMQEIIKKEHPMIIHITRLHPEAVYGLGRRRRKR